MDREATELGRGQVREYLGQARVFLRRFSQEAAVKKLLKLARVTDTEANREMLEFAFAWADQFYKSLRADQARVPRKAFKSVAAAVTSRYRNRERAPYESLHLCTCEERQRH